MQRQFTKDWFSRHADKWRDVLADYVGQPKVRYLEIGSYEGRSVAWMCREILTGENSQAVCIDVWDDRDVETRFDANVAGLAVDKRVGESRSELIRCNYGPQFDIAYIDGSHEARDVLSDAVLAFHLLKNEGVLIFDDYQWDLPNRVQVFPKVAIDGFLAAYAPVVDVLVKGYQVILKKK